MHNFMAYIARVCTILAMAINKAFMSNKIVVVFLRCPRVPLSSVGWPCCLLNKKEKKKPIVNICY